MTRFLSPRRRVSSARPPQRLRLRGLVGLAAFASGVSAQPAAVLPACAPRDGRDAFRQTLRLEVLSSLETLDGSPFARAHVVGCLAAQDPSDDEHWTVWCGRFPVDASPARRAMNSARPWGRSVWTSSERRGERAKGETRANP